MRGASDIAEIKQLVARYNHLLDSGDGEAWASAFVEDGRFETARMRAYLMVVAQREIAVTGSYEDILRPEDGRWLFVERRFTSDAATDR